MKRVGKPFAESSRQKRMLPPIKLDPFGDLTSVQRFWIALKHASSEYANSTNVNGFFHLRVNESTGFKRAFWIIIIILSFSFGSILLANLVRQFFDIPFLMTVGSPVPLLNIPFPAVSICHPQTVINSKARKLIEKIAFWIIIIILSFSFGSILLANLVRQFFDIPFLMTVGSPVPLLNIPFPAVSICHPQTVINSKARKLIEKIKVPDDVTKDDLLRNLPQALGVFIENQWGSLNLNDMTMIHEVLEFNGMTVDEAIREVGIDCEDFIVRCSFNKKRFPCFQDTEYFTWRTTMSHIGRCCSFNYNPNNASYEPMKVNSFGIRGGLTFIGTSFPHLNDGRSGLLFSDGFFLLMHPPYDFPTDANSMTFLEVGKISSIAIYPTISTVSDDVKALPVEARSCLIGDDVGLSIYRQPACAVNCIRNFIYDKCACHPYYLPVDENTKLRDCNMLDGDCFERIYFDVKKIRCGSCLPSCEDTNYKMSSSTIPYNFINTSVNPIYDETNVTKYEFTAHIYFADSIVPVQNRIITLSFIQLLSNFGGVFNLCLGMSIISVLELIYHFFMKLPQYINRRNKILPVITTVKSTNNLFQ